MKKFSLIIILLSLFILTGCSKSSKIAEGKIESVKVQVLSTNHDDESFFALIPIVTTTGKTTTTTFIPVWNNIDHLTVKYKYQGKNYKTTTDDFTVRKYRGHPYARLRKSDIGNKKAPIVLYTHDK
ncbi:hypothetical protein [Lactococcus lactis]|uniref:hypothetical protein n=1 Tax=Lactococcus lactis TaxID=1358 RepID=UPI001F57B7C7|nr:hypothetical protein [Lactococcus lactis]